MRHPLALRTAAGALCLLAALPSAAQDARWEALDDEITSALRQFRADAEAHEARLVAEATRPLADSLVAVRQRLSLADARSAAAEAALAPARDSLANEARLRQTAEAALDTLRARVTRALQFATALLGAQAWEAETAGRLADSDYEFRGIENRTALGGLRSLTTVVVAAGAQMDSLTTLVAGPMTPPPVEPEPEPEPFQSAWSEATWARGANTTATLDGDVLRLTMPATGGTWFIQPVEVGRYVLEIRGSGYVRIYDKSAPEAELTLSDAWRQLDLDLSTNLNLDNFGDGALDAEVRLRPDLSP